MTGLALTVTGEGRHQVLLLHPLGGDLHFFDPLVTRLPDIRTVRCDLPGHGDTGASPDDTVAAMSERLERSLRSAELTALVVVGVSLGGLVAQHLAATAPDLVAALVLADTVARYPEPLQTQWRTRAEELSAGRAKPLDYLDATLQVWFDDEVSAEAVDYVHRALGECTADGYAQACRALERADTSALVGELRMPTAVVCGRQDGPAFRSAVDWFLDRLPHATARWLAHKHASALQDPSAFATVLIEFLQSLPSTPLEGVTRDH